jgi:hypothetical protein
VDTHTGTGTTNLIRMTRRGPAKDISSSQIFGAIFKKSGTAHAGNQPAGWPKPLVEVSDRRRA